MISEVTKRFQDGDKKIFFEKNLEFKDFSNPKISIEKKSQIFKR